MKKVKGMFTALKELEEKKAKEEMHLNHTTGRHYEEKLPEEIEIKDYQGWYVNPTAIAERMNQIIKYLRSTE